MKYFLFIFLAIASLDLRAEIIESGWTTPEEQRMPSCLLYKKRVSNYVQRLSELEIAERLQRGSLTIEDVLHFYELSQRTLIPLNLESVAFFQVKIFVPLEKRMVFNNGKKITVNSELLKWSSENFDLPSSLVRMDYNDGVLSLEVEQSYFQACLLPDRMTLSFSSEFDTFEVILNLDKYAWDLERRHEH